MAAFKILLGFLVLGASAETGPAEGAESKQNVSTAEEMDPMSKSSLPSPWEATCPCGTRCLNSLGGKCVKRECKDCGFSGTLARTSKSSLPSPWEATCPCGTRCVNSLGGKCVKRECKDCGFSGTLARTADVSTNFLHCPCGLDCQKDLGKEHGFQLLQGCSCLSCNLRGAAESASPVEGTASADDFVALLAEQEQDWDAASLPDSQLTFCRCGSLQNSCRSCEETSKSRHGLTCPCGTVCLKRLQWFQGNGWCIKRACRSPCR